MGVMVSRIQRFSLEDGPGIRTTVFLMGCNFRCVWCHNPESLANHSILGVDSSLCDGCQRCLSFCPQHALSMVGSSIAVDREMCDNCGLCVPECLGGSFLCVDDTILMIHSWLQSRKTFHIIRARKVGLRSAVENLFFS